MKKLKNWSGEEEWPINPDSTVLYTIPANPWAEWDIVDAGYEAKEERQPNLPAEVHNPTRVDPEAAMAAVRSLCGG